MKHVLLLASLLTAAPALAETTVSLDIFKITEAMELVDGQEVETRVLNPIASSLPGDLLSYRLSVENQDATIATDISISLPIDASVELLATSVTSSLGAAATFSEDGTNFLRAEELTGSTIAKARFDIESLDPGATGTIEFEALVR